MKKLFLIIWLVTGSVLYASSQNYISGTVSLHGNNTAGGATTVAPGASFIINKNSFYEQGAFINQGDSTAISADSGTLVLSGTNGQAITGRFKIGALRLDNAAGAVINNSEPNTMVTILDSVSFGGINSAEFNAGNGLMTLRSNALKTARIADLTHNDANTGNAVTGKVIAERYLQSKRAWRLLGPPTTADSTNDQTIQDAWQEGVRAPRGQIVNPNPGYGTVISRPGSNPVAASGYDDGVAGATAYSMRMYTKDGLQVSPQNTDLTHFSAHAAYILFVRGDRSVGPSPQNPWAPTPSAVTTLRSKGSLHNGDVVDTVTNASGGFAGVANPYACTVDFSKVILNGVVNGFYVVDPTINSVGAFVYIDGTDNYRATPAGAFTNGATNRLLQSGQAVLLRSTGSTGTLTFKENSKNITSLLNGFRQFPLPALNINLYNNDSLLLDGVSSVFDDGFSKSNLPDEDIYKPENQNENLSFYSNGSSLIKNRWPEPAAGDTLHLKLWKTTARKYRFVAEANGLSAASQAYLTDKYLHTSVAINGSDKTDYAFEITKDAASATSDRFAVVFGSAVLPVTITRLKAYLDNGDAHLVWTVQNETNVAHYEVEKSADGHSFSSLATVAVNNETGLNKTYDFLDLQPASGDHFYRIKSVGLNGKSTYTTIASVTVTGGIMTVQILPNPVLNGKLSLLFTNAPAGNYKVVMNTSDGKAVFTKTIAHTGGTFTYTYQLDKLAKGVYSVQINGNNRYQYNVNLKAILQ